MAQKLAHLTLVVRDYDEALAFFTQKLNFVMVEDTPVPEQHKRWVVIAPSGGGTGLVLGKASTPAQEASIGNQTGGRVFLFLGTDSFWQDYRRMVCAGITFERLPQHQPYGWVAVFKDLYGNLWDLLQQNQAQNSGLQN